jgi:NADH-quinone oxidoreductase E subunit
MIDEKTAQEIRELQKMYPDRRSMVMGALWAVQRRSQNVLTKEDLENIAALLELSPVEVQAVASFYTQYNLVSPVGRYHIQLCRNISCTLLDAEKILEHLERSLGIECGQVTADGRFSLTTVECLGSCGTAPMMQINDDYYEDLTPEKVDRILESLT